MMTPKYKKVLMPITVPDGIYCWNHITEEICYYFDNEGGHPSCDLGLHIFGNSDKFGCKKNKKCLNFSNLFNKWHFQIYGSIIFIDSVECSKKFSIKILASSYSRTNIRCVMKKNKIGFGGYNLKFHILKRQQFLDDG